MTRMKTLVIANQKGGVGKSNTAYNLGHYLAEKKAKRTLFIDFDEQGSASLSLRNYAGELNASAFFGTEPIKVAALSGDLVLAKGDAKLPAIETEFRPTSRHSELIQNLKNRLADVCNEFDWCVIDTPGSNSVIANATLAAADFVLVPSIVDAYSIDIATKMLKRIIGIQKTANPKLVNLGILPTLINSTAPSQRKDLENLLQKFNQYVIRAKISNRTSYREAAGDGIPVWKLKKTTARDAANEMIGTFDVLAEKLGV